MTTPDSLRIRADVRDAVLTREQVLEWEARRIVAAARRLRVPAPAVGRVSDRREALLRAKLELGPDEIRRRLRRDLVISDRLGTAEAALSPRRRRSVTRLLVTGGSAAAFVDWFRARSAESDELAMLRACPDHFVIRTDGDGRQEVIETTGGSPLATEFRVDYDDVATLVTPPDPSYPRQIAGVARGAGDRPIGGVRHQFRDTGDGFEALLTVEFPLPTLPRMVSGHRLHLACEFSNWIEAAFT
ncbi:MAG: hypothetical protein PGN29_04570 [Gordonia paraffinivorans]